MSSYHIDLPSPDEINYHEARQVQRVERARKMIDVGDVISVVESRLSQESDPRQHPLFDLANFLLDRQTAVDGAKLYNDWRQRILCAISTLIDDCLETMED